jgi:hypothetical protein
LLAALVIVVVASLGQKLTIGGHRSISLPWSIVANWPLFENVLPARLAMFVSLVTAVIAALWTAAQPPGMLRWLLPGLAVLAIAPNPAAGVWASHYTVPAFFTDIRYRSCLAPDENILPLPVRGDGESMLWQVVSHFRFRMAGGRIAPQPPASFLAPPDVAEVAGDNPLPASEAPALAAFIKAKDVTTVVVDASLAPDWTGALDRIATPHPLGGVIVYHISDGSPSCPGAS